MENDCTIATLRAAVAPIAKRCTGFRACTCSAPAHTALQMSKAVSICGSTRVDSVTVELSSFHLDLEDALGTRVDLVTSDAPDRAFLNRIAEDEVLLYEG